MKFAYFGLVFFIIYVNCSFGFFSYSLTFRPSFQNIFCKSDGISDDDVPILLCDSSPRLEVTSGSIKSSARSETSQDEPNSSTKKTVSFRRRMFEPISRAVKAFRKIEKKEMVSTFAKSVMFGSFSPDAVLLTKAVGTNSTGDAADLRYNISIVHDGATCDCCGMKPIVGIRYKCTIRNNFDLCEACEALETRPHTMVKYVSRSLQNNDTLALKVSNSTTSNAVSNLFFGMDPYLSVVQIAFVGYLFGVLCEVAYHWLKAKRAGLL